MKGSAGGNWDPREGQQPFRSNPNGAGNRTTTLRRLLIGAQFFFDNPCQSEEGALAWDRQLCLDQWRRTRKGWRQPQEIQQVRKESKRTSETPPSTWLGGAQRGSLCASSWGPSKESLSLLCKSFFRSLLTYASPG